MTEKNGKLQVSSQNKKYSQIVPLLKSLFHSTLVLLPNLSSPPTTLLVLSQTEKLIPYITGFRKLIKQLITSVLDIWSRATGTADDDDDKANKAHSEEQDAVRIAAFLWIRKVMSVGDRSLKEICLKVPPAYGYKTYNSDLLRSLRQERSSNYIPQSPAPQLPQKLALRVVRV